MVCMLILPRCVPGISFRTVSPSHDSAPVDSAPVDSAIRSATPSFSLAAIFFSFFSCFYFPRLSLPDLLDSADAKPLGAYHVLQRLDAIWRSITEAPACHPQQSLVGPGGFARALGT